MYRMDRNQWTVYEPGLDYFVDKERERSHLVVAWMDPAVMNEHTRAHDDE